LFATQMIRNQRDEISAKINIQMQK
jgi:hypothetical protein